MRDANQRPPVKRLIAVLLFVIAVSVLWTYSNRASIYSLRPTPGHHVVYYVESSSGCILWLFLWDMRGMDALPFEGDLHGPLTPIYRWAFFGHEEGEKLHPFSVFTGIQSSSSAFGFTLPYWLFIVLAAGYGALTLQRWLSRLADPREKPKTPEVNKVIHRLSFVFLILFVAQFTNSAAAQTNLPPTREEVLRGALTPLRTCYDVTSYYLDVRVDPTTQTIKGSNKISFKAVADFEQMQVDLATNMAIEKIIFDDRTPATFTRELSAVFIQLPEKVKKRSDHSVTIYYSGKPQVARRPPWDGGVSWERDTNGNPWVVVTSSETGASIWWPLKDHPADEPDNMTIAITAPAGLDEISNGRLKSKTVLPDGWVRWEWFVSYPINSYCVTFNIGKYAHFDDEYVSADGQKLTLDYYVLPENLEKAKEQFKQVKTMLTVFEKYFGKYPFYRDGYKLIESPHTGMEHQSAIAYGNRYMGGYRGRASSEVGRKFDFIIIHESAHEWWGNSVTMKDMADMWIHESFGAYAESLFVEEQYGRAEALKYINGKKRNVRNAHPIISEYGLNRMSNGDMYDKGQLVLNTLRSVLDDDKLWFSLLRGIQQTFKYRNVSADELIAYLNKKSGKNLSYFFDQYYRRANIPTLVVRLEAEDGFVSVRYRWENAVTNFRMPVKVTTAPGKYEFITPTTEWKTKKLRGLAPEDFKVAEDLFYLKLDLSRGSLEPLRNPSHSRP